MGLSQADVLAAPGPQRRLRILFAMAHSGYARNFESTLRLLLERGHTVHVALDRGPDIAGDDDIVARIAQSHPGLSSERSPLSKALQHSPFSRGAVAIRCGLDYLHYLQPAFEDVPALRERAAARAPAPVRRGAARLPQSLVGESLRLLHTAARPSETFVRYVAQHAPDVVVVTPLVEFGAPQLEYVLAAKRLGVPVVHLVASWDNLTTKGRLSEQVDAVVVWNEAQLAEARDLHGLPVEKVVVTGAPGYDQWFGREPSCSRDAFCAKVGLQAEGDLLLYLGSSAFIAPNEQLHVAKWLQRLRQSPLANVQVLIRPHPSNPLIGHRQGNELERVVGNDPLAVVWPSGGANPTTEEARRDYFDSLHHARAIVGVNTSALIESAIVGRPIFALTPESRNSRPDTLHVHHLEGALAGSARTYEEHFGQLEAALAHPSDIAPTRTFVQRFIRPHGLDVPTTPMVVEAIEAAADHPQRVDVPELASGTLHRKLDRAAHRLQRRLPSDTRARAPRGDRPLRVLFAMHYPGYLRYFDTTVRTLAARGHDVFLCFDSIEKQAEGLAALDDGPAGITVLSGRTPRRHGAEKEFVSSLRRVGNYVQYLHPRFANAEYLRRRTRERLPRGFTAIGRLNRLPVGVVRVLQVACAAVERAMPVAPEAAKLLARVRPNVVVVSPLVAGVSPQADLLQAAAAARIPRALAVGSWDHLTTKGVIRFDPDRIFVWNEIQRREAIELHRIPPKNIVITGAQPFDKWFDRTPGTDRVTFCARAGLDDGRPFVVFVGSTASISAPDREIQFVKEWIRRVRSSDDPNVARLGILVRPHPYNREHWSGTDDTELGADAVVWPRRPVNPVDESDRTDYFDSLFHSSAVVGVNTSAMIEAAIVGRPVLTIESSEFSDTQSGTIHFNYMRPERGGFLRMATDIGEHLAQLGEVLSEPELVGAQLESFVQRFVRPLGADRDGTTALADAIEATAYVAPGRRRRSLLLVALRKLAVRAARRARIGNVLPLRPAPSESRERAGAGR